MGDDLTLKGFMLKYGLDKGWVPLDQDPNTADVQNQNIDIPTFLTDFNSLSYEDRFVFFKLLEKHSEHELLKIISGRLPDQDIDKDSLMKQVRRFREDMQAKTGTTDYFLRPAREHSNQPKEMPNKWEIRYEIEKGLYSIGSMLSTAQALYVRKQQVSEVIEDLRNQVGDELRELYRVIGFDGDLSLCNLPSGSLYFDSDDDFDPETPPNQRDLYFDDKDFASMDRSEFKDSDGDGIGDNADIEPNNAAVWSGIKEGEMISVPGLCDVTRDKDDRYKITIRIHFVAADDLNSKQRSEMLNEEYLSQLVKSINEAYIKHREEGAESIDLDVQFVNRQQDAHHTVWLSGDDVYRLNYILWGSKILRFPWCILHEVMHLLGLPDLYHEIAVHGGIRDHTMQPGLRMIDRANIMAEGLDIIRLQQLKGIIVRCSKQHNGTWQVSNENDGHNKTILNHTYSYYQEEAWFAFHRLDRYGRNNLKSHAMRLLATGNNDKIVIANVALFMCSFEQGDIKAAMEYLEKISDKLEDTSHAIIWYLYRKGRKDLAESLYLKKSNTSSDTANNDLYQNLMVFAEAAFEAQQYADSKRYFEMAQYAGSISNDELFDLNDFEHYLMALRRLDNYDKLVPFYEVKLSRDPYNLDCYRELILAYCGAKDFDKATCQLIEGIKVVETISRTHHLTVDDRSLSRLSTFADFSSKIRVVLLARIRRLSANPNITDEEFNELLYYKKALTLLAGEDPMSDFSPPLMGGD